MVSPIRFTKIYINGKWMQCIYQLYVTLLIRQIALWNVALLFFKLMICIIEFNFSAFRLSRFSQSFGVSVAICSKIEWHLYIYIFPLNNIIPM